MLSETVFVNIPPLNVPLPSSIPTTLQRPRSVSAVCVCVVRPGLPVSTGGRSCVRVCCVHVLLACACVRHSV